MGIVAQGRGSPARGFRVRAESGADHPGCDSAVSASSGPVVLGAGIGAAGVLGAVLAVFHDAGDAGHRGQAGAGAAGKQQRQGEGTDSWETRIVHGHAPWSWKGKERDTASMRVECAATSADGRGPVVAFEAGPERSSGRVRGPGAARKSVGLGKSVSVRVALGGRRILIKKHKKQ